MAIENEVYADGVYQIHMLEQTIRMDLMRLQPNPENNAPLPKPFERIIMTPQGFLRTYEAMGQIIQNSALSVAIPTQPRRRSKPAAVESHTTPVRFSSGCFFVFILLSTLKSKKAPFFPLISAILCGLTGSW